jgi:hypothetical protein
MSSALANFDVKKIKAGQSPAGIGAILAYNEITKEVLPPIVRELEEKIAELQKTVEELRKLILETKH